MLDYINNCIDKLCNTPRWVTFDTIDTGTVGEHTFLVAHIAYQIALTEENCDENEVVKRALFHDIEEAYTGDLPRFSKRGNEKFEETLKKVEEDAVDRMLEKTKIKDKDRKNIKEIWKASKDESIEGEVLAQADILATVYDIYRESLRGNKRIKNYKDIGRGIEYAKKTCEKNQLAKETLENMLKEIEWENNQ